MRQIVLRPSGVVQLPGGYTLDIATALPAGRVVAAPAPRPQQFVRVTAPEPQATIQATSVGLVPAAGTVVTSIPANLLAGPEATISAFTIITLDSGTW
jgi:hypothetical protein